MKFDLFEVVLVLLAGISMGTFLMGLGLSDDIKHNTVDGYHCTPITKHIGIESAKKQVSAYQAMVKGG